jgi:exopolysaccharide biosynthesis predicted pyruvyltransferase EpsI
MLRPANGGPMTEPDTKTNLMELFTLYRDRTWYFMSPGGNWGDHLIYMGAESLARSIGLHCINLCYNTIDSGSLPPGACIYLHGGGGFNPWGSQRAFGNLHGAAQVPNAIVVQGPQTSDVKDKSTASLFKHALADSQCADLHFFVREQTTLRFLAEVLPPSVKLHLDHDTAFHISQNELLEVIGFKQTPSGRYELLVSREDDEAPVEPLLHMRTVTLDPAYFATSFAHWVRIHAYASKITTNRLHSAIAGSILGKHVELLPGSYHKNRSIWEYSLAQRGVEWRDHPNDCPHTGPNYWARLPQFLARSWKIQRLMMRIRGVPLK